MQTITVQLIASLDPSQPTLQAETLDGIGRCFQTCRIVSSHPVWRGCVLSKNHVKIVQVEQVTG